MTLLDTRRRPERSVAPDDTPTQGLPPVRTPVTQPIPKLTHAELMRQAKAPVTPDVYPRSGSFVMEEILWKLAFFGVIVCLVQIAILYSGNSNPARNPGLDLKFPTPAVTAPAVAGTQPPKARSVPAAAPTTVRSARRAILGPPGKAARSGASVATQLAPDRRRTETAAGKAAGTTPGAGTPSATPTAVVSEAPPGGGASTAPEPVPTPSVPDYTPIPPIPGGPPPASPEPRG